VTSVTDPLVAWLRACFDEDERIALACIDEVGSHRRDDEFDDGSGTADYDAFPSYPWGSSGRELAFMAGPGQPASVLADVAAKRALIDVIFRYESKIDNEWGCCHSAADIEAGACPVSLPREIEALLILARAYAGRPGWRAEWGTDRG
jgi:hypothetical protein